MPSEPAYRRVANDLRTEILTGRYVAGEKLPSYLQLAQRFGVSLGIVREAVGILRGEGLVEPQQGAGVFVRTFAPITRNSPGRLSRAQWGSGKAIQDHDTGPRWRTVGVEVRELMAPEEIAQALGLEPDQPALTRTRRFEVDDRPVQLATSYYAADVVRATRIAQTDTGPGGSYARLAELGHAPVRFSETVISRAPYPEEATELQLPKVGGLVFDLTRYAYTAEDRCIEVNRMILDAAAYRLEYHFTA